MHVKYDLLYTLDLDDDYCLAPTPELEDSYANSCDTRTLR